jgi:ParB/RepB/Spo0J family partition protein
MLKQRRKSAKVKSRSVQLRIGDIVPDTDQPRKSIAGEKLSELTQSLLGSGQISPIVVRPTSEGKYMIVVGERRWRAAKESGLSHIDCIIRHDLDDQKARDLQFAENYMREDIAPLEQARAFQDYLDKYKVSQREMSRRTGIPQRTISARLALLRLPESMRAQIEAGHIGPHDALMIFSLPPNHQDTVLSLMVSGKLGGRALESLYVLSKANPDLPIDEIIKQAKHGPVLPSSQTSKEHISPDAATADTGSTTSGLSLSVSQLHDLIALIQIIKEQGVWQLEDCELLDNDGQCKVWNWDNRESIPEGVGEPVCLGPSNWVVKPSVLLCGICLGWDSHLISSTLNTLWDSPLTMLRKTFECDCGAKGQVAVHIKCTKCGKDTWHGWWSNRLSTTVGSSTNWK